MKDIKAEHNSNERFVDEVMREIHGINDMMALEIKQTMEDFKKKEEVWFQQVSMANVDAEKARKELTEERKQWQAEKLLLQRQYEDRLQREIYLMEKKLDAQLVLRAQLEGQVEGFKEGLKILANS